MTNRTGIMPLLLGVAGMLAAGTSIAAAAGDPRGQKLAEQYCTRCHVIDQSGKAGWTNAPSFMSLANRPGTTMQSLEKVIGQPHMDMVNLPRPPAETQAIAAYIMSLRTQ
ncbi:c-type cytochrome [Rhodopila sp.]|jgi:cytochrome c2|uniref:c-type cytochrome n=1 Tax=Rhodopila sp. TaxID=2480087 RepID=UPI002CDF5FB0|nr:c-type cytochrome [Rhodopila sp.]HVZ10230.1 c-type cytochrome [Rhodopila sp.]